MRRLPGTLQQLMRDKRASIAMEAALVLPILFACIFGVIEVSRVMWVQHSLQEATDAAARCAAIDSITCPDSTAIAAFAANRAEVVNVDATNFAHITDTCGEKVTASYHYVSSVAALVPINITLGASACHP